MHALIAAAVLALAGPAAAQVNKLYGLAYDTTNGTATLRISGGFYVAKDSTSYTTTLFEIDTHYGVTIATSATVDGASVTMKGAAAYIASGSSITTTGGFFGSSLVSGVSTTADADTQVTINASAGTAGVAFKNAGTTRGYMGVEIGAGNLVTGSGANDMVFRNAGASNAFRWGVGSAMKMTLSLDGFLGIGTASPTSKLEVLTASGNNVVASSSTASGFGVFLAVGTSGGCLMIRDTDNAGWIECTALNGTLSCAIDADGVCD